MYSVWRSSQGLCGGQIEQLPGDLVLVQFGVFSGLLCSVRLGGGLWSVLVMFVICLGLCVDHSNMCLGNLCLSGCRSVEDLFAAQVGNVSSVFLLVGLFVFSDSL